MRTTGRFFQPKEEAANIQARNVGRTRFRTSHSAMSAGPKFHPVTAPISAVSISARVRAVKRYKDGHSSYTAIAAESLSIGSRNPAAE